MKFHLAAPLLLHLLLLLFSCFPPSHNHRLGSVIIRREVLEGPGQEAPLLRTEDFASEDLPVEHKSGEVSLQLPDVFSIPRSVTSDLNVDLFFSLFFVFLNNPWTVASGEATILAPVGLNPREATRWLATEEQLTEELLLSHIILGEIVRPEFLSSQVSRMTLAGTEVNLSINKHGEILANNVLVVAWKQYNNTLIIGLEDYLFRDEIQVNLPEPEEIEESDDADSNKMSVSLDQALLTASEKNTVDPTIVKAEEGVTELSSTDSSATEQSTNDEMTTELNSMEETATELIEDDGTQETTEQSDDNNTTTNLPDELPFLGDDTDAIEATSTSVENSTEIMGERGGGQEKITNQSTRVQMMANQSPGCSPVSKIPLLSIFKSVKVCTKTPQLSRSTSQRQSDVAVISGGDSKGSEGDSARLAAFTQILNLIHSGAEGTPAQNKQEKKSETNVEDSECPEDIDCFEKLAQTETREFDREEERESVPATSLDHHSHSLSASNRESSIQDVSSPEKLLRKLYSLEGEELLPTQLRQQEGPVTLASLVDQMGRRVHLLRGGPGVGLFQELFKETNLEVELIEGEKATLIVPIDEAFSEWSPLDWGFNPFDVPEFVNETIINHVVPEELALTHLVDGTQFETLGGRIVRINIKGGAYFINSIPVIGEMELDQGHVVFIRDILWINRTVVDHLNKEYGYLETGPLLSKPWPKSQFLSHALRTLEGLPQYSQLASYMRESPALGEFAQAYYYTNKFEGYTLFAPSNVAFQSLANSSIDPFLKDPELRLYTVLGHLVLGRYFLPDLANSTNLLTLADRNVTVNTLQNGTITLDDGSSSSSSSSSFSVVTGEPIIVFNLGNIIPIDRVLFIQPQDVELALESSSPPPQEFSLLSSPSNSDVLQLSSPSNSDILQLPDEFSSHSSSSTSDAIKLPEEYSLDSSTPVSNVILLPEEVSLKNFPSAGDVIKLPEEYLSLDSPSTRDVLRLVDDEESETILQDDVSTLNQGKEKEIRRIEEILSLSDLFSVNLSDPSDPTRQFDGTGATSILNTDKPNQKEAEPKKTAKPRIVYINNKRVVVQT